MTILQWLETQLALLDTPAYVTGYIDGVLDGKRQTLEAMKQMIAKPKEKADGTD